MCSTVGAGRNTKVEKNMIALPPYQKSVVIGILLSDGHLASTKPHENPHLAFKQSLKNSSYVLLVFSILSHYCNLYPSWLCLFSHFSLLLQVKEKQEKLLKVVEKIR